MNIKDFIYFATFILFCLVISEKQYLISISECLKSSENLIKKVIIFSNLIIIISMFFSNSYYLSWGENVKYFKGFTVMPQVMAAANLYMIILTMYYFKNKKIKLLDYTFFIIPSISIFATGARTFLIPLVILIILIGWKKLGLIRLILVSIMFFPAILYLFKKSSIYSKFIYVINFQYSDSILSKLTSGRSDVWNSCLNHYWFQYNFLEKIVGTSFDNVYNIINYYTNMNIWAHNDVINTMITSGVVGIILYFFSFFRMVNLLEFYKVKMSKRILFFLIYLIIMLTNGLFVSVMTVFSMLIFIEVLVGGNK